MLKTFYANFGFVGSVLIALAGFLIIILWISSIAGISMLPESKHKTLKLVAAALIPPYAIFWLIVDVYQQHDYMTSK
jgi:hypothetical protein